MKPRVLSLPTLVLAIALLAVCLPTQASATCSSFPGNLIVDPGETATFRPRVSDLRPDVYFLSIEVRGHVNFDSIDFLIGGLDRFSGTAANTTFGFRASADNPPGATAFVTLKVTSRFGSEECNESFTITISGEPCADGAYWMNPGATSWGQHSRISATYDYGSCFVRFAPRNEGSAFVWENAYFVHYGADGDCDVGWDNGAACLLGWAPGGTSAFLWNGQFRYFE